MAEKGAALLALLPKGLSKGEAEPDGDEELDDPKTTAARDFFEAGKKGDWNAASEALETFVLNCMHKGDETEEA